MASSICIMFGGEGIIGEAMHIVTLAVEWYAGHYE